MSNSPSQTSRKGFFGWLGTLSLWVLAFLGLVVLAFTIGIAIFLSSFTTPKTVSINNNSIVKISLNQEENTVYGNIPFLPNNALKVSQMAQALEKAKSDNRIKGIFLKLGNKHLTFAQIQELAPALLDFKKSGKPIYAYAEDINSFGHGMSQYALASFSNKVWLQPQGGIGLIGISIEMPFAGKLLKTLGVEVDMQQRKAYKGGIDIYTRQNMSDAVRGNLTNLAQSLQKQITKTIERNRPQLAGKVQGLIDNGPYQAQEAKKHQLIDNLGFQDDAQMALEQSILKKENSGKSDGKSNDFNYIKLKDYYYAVQSKPKKGGPAIAVIHGVGEIMADSQGMDGFAPYAVKKAFQTALHDNTIKAVVFRVDSPGGAHGLSAMIHHQVELLRRAGKPVVVSMGSVAASGGYYVSMGSDYIFANGATLTGSIGVYAGKFATQKVWQMFGINWDRIMTSKNANMYSFITPFTPKENNRFTHMIDMAYADFSQTAAKNRHLSQKALEQVAGGRVWTGEQALQRGLIDGIGTLHDAINKAKELAKIKGEVTLVSLPHAVGPFDMLLSLIHEGPQSFFNKIVQASLQSVIKSKAPRISTLIHSKGILSMPPLHIED